MFHNLRLQQHWDVQAGTQRSVAQRHPSAPAGTDTCSQDGRLGKIVGYKARLNFPGNGLRQGVHYDPYALSVQMTYRSSVRLVLSLSTQLVLLTYHVDIAEEFLHELHNGKQPLYVNGITNFDGKITREDTVLKWSGTFTE